MNQNTTANFDSLAKKSFAPDATSDDYEKMFAAVFSLSEWHFIAVGEMPNIAPYCAVFPDVFGDKPAVAVFTDVERARKFIAESNTKFGSADKPIVINAGDDQIKFSSEDLILSVSTENVLNFIERLIPKGIVKIFFNANTDSHGFSHDLKMMRPIYEHLENKKMIVKTPSGSTPNAGSAAQPIGGNVDFDALARKANESGGAMKALNDLFGAAFNLPEWQFIMRGELPNVYPYVASNAATADNQSMIRAFTDSVRLINFAKENNLTEADGSCRVLTIPTKEIIPYLEQFIGQGAYGVWFNSDSKSDGFFIPIKQLRPIKEHLTKLNSSTKTVLIKVKDGLRLPAGFISPADYACNFYARVPLDWLDGENLREEKLEKIYQKVYGATWRSGNSDGSQYVVLESSTRRLTPDEVKTTKFDELKTTDDDQYWFYNANENGDFDSLKADEFQKEIDAENQKAKKETARNRQDNLADWGMSETPDGDLEQNLTINQAGAVKFDALIAPFYEAIVPLLKDYQGTGDFVSLLAFDPVGKSKQVENIVKNAHGEYLQIRRFWYLNPKNNVRIGVNSIHSRRLRHIKSNAELLVSFELCKNIDNRTGVFYHALQGPKSDVLNLIAAIQPILEKVGYEPVS